MHSQYINPEHLEELVKVCGINLDIINLNFKSLQGITAYEYLLISQLLPRTNTGMVQKGWLLRYAHITQGGWWCSGLDPLNDWQNMEWGCFKPNKPRENENGKLIKYEHPPSTPTRVFCLKVPLSIWRSVAQHYNLSLPENIVISEAGEAMGFWQWVRDCNIPVIICEGVKKAAALLSEGYAAIGIPGITSAYRVVKDRFGKVISRQLISDLAAFADFRSNFQSLGKKVFQKRTFYICFDFETESKKIAAVSNAISQIGLLLQQKGANVHVIQLPGVEKGVDDFLVAKGAIAFEKLYSQSLDLEVYLGQIKPHHLLSIPPTIKVNQRYLRDINFPNQGLVAVKSAKGTGKTTALQKVVQEAKIKNKPVLLITHRIQLGKFLCEKIGIRWGVNNSEWEIEEKTKQLTSSNGYFTPDSLGLCIDSLWKLNPEEWQGAIIILDEVEQSLWHLLNSNTCKQKRVKILKVFQQLIATVIQTSGLVIAQDADLSDVSLEYLQALTGVKINPWLLVNEWKPEKGWDITFYDSPNPTPLIQQLELDLRAGRKCYVTTDSRSGRYSCETIEKYIKERLQKLLKLYPKTLLISSRTTNTPGHKAVSFVENINDKVFEYDAIFVTPSLGTGVSIDVRHFDKVYGIFQGVIPDSEARQALARIREDVPRVIWCAKRGIGLIGSGSKNYRLLSEWYQENQKENLALLSPLHKIDVDLPLVYDPIHLRTWAKLSARINSSVSLFRQSMKEGLIADGHQIWVRSNDSHHNIIRDLRYAFFATDKYDIETRKRLIVEIVKAQRDWDRNKEKAKEVNKNIKEIKRQNQLSAAMAVANAKDIDYVEYEVLTSKHSLRDCERHQLNKYMLRQKYGIEVTPTLKLNDDKGYYSQLLIHYYLTHESEYFRLRDKQEWNQQLYWGEGKVFLPDLNTYTLKIEALRALGMLRFLEIGREFTEVDEEIVILKNATLQCSQHIQRSLEINLVRGQEEISGIKILGRLLNLLGLKLKKIDDNENNNNNHSNNNSYCIDPKNLCDTREKIFVVWQGRDELMLENYSSNVDVPSVAKKSVLV
jgi:Domain of unknown function (DUF3854)/Origin of replication binding protein